jgi:hypothetical protein
VDDQGFWVGGDNGSVFVRPAGNRSSDAAPAVGHSVSIEGIVLQMPRSLRDDANARSSANDDIYVSATSIQ